jgi:RNA polymerase sigma-70 factor (ECF subfamily)
LETGERPPRPGGSHFPAAGMCFMDHRACKLAELVERYYALLYRYAYRLTGSQADAEDLTQQAFLVAHDRWEQLRDEDKAKSWLFTIARNAWLKELRAPRCRASCLLDELPGPPAETDLSDFDEEQLQSALNELPEEFRSPVILFYFREFTYKEIAATMGVPIGTVMSRLARAKAVLRQRLTAPAPAATVLTGSPDTHSGFARLAVPNARAT